MSRSIAPLRLRRSSVPSAGSKISAPLPRANASPTILSTTPRSASLSYGVESMRPRASTSEQRSLLRATQWSADSSISGLARENDAICGRLTTSDFGSGSSFLSKLIWKERPISENRSLSQPTHLQQLEACGSYVVTTAKTAGIRPGKVSVGLFETHDRRAPIDGGLRSPEGAGECAGRCIGILYEQHGEFALLPRSTLPHPYLLHHCQALNVHHEVQTDAAKFATKRKGPAEADPLSFCLKSSPSGKAGTGAIGMILPLDTLTL